MLSGGRVCLRCCVAKRVKTMFQDTLHFVSLFGGERVKLVLRERRGEDEVGREEETLLFVAARRERDSGGCRNEKDEGSSKADDL